MTSGNITPARLNELDEITQAATPGPWSHTDSGAIVAPIPQAVIADVWEPTAATRNGEFIEAARDAMPGLIDEIRRLTALLAELERITTPRTLRICACSHGHLAHAVPAPHACFAYGQTCPCEAYRQLPHDEAVAQLDRNQRALAERAAHQEMA